MCVKIKIIKKEKEVDKMNLRYSGSMAGLIDFLKDQIEKDSREKSKSIFKMKADAVSLIIELGLN